jgi:hypothetical protein
MKLYVATVASTSLRKQPDSIRPNKDWSCFVDTTVEGAVAKAQRAMAEWTKTYAPREPYKIFVGELTGYVDPSPIVVRPLENESRGFEIVDPRDCSSPGVKLGADFYRDRY